MLLAGTLRVPIRAFLTCGFALAGPFAYAQVNEWLDKNVFDRIQLSGRRVLGYHAQSVEGDKEAFNSLTYYGKGGRKFSDTGQMSVVGTNVFGVLNFQMQFSDNRYNDPESQRVSLDYKKGPISVSLGDIRGSLLNTNQFASFNRSLRGVDVGYKSGRLALKGVRSEAKGSAATISVQGDNSVGPYYLRSSRLAKDSVSVRVDGQEMLLLQDYTVNYDLGSITFVNRIVPPTSTILVTYEALGAGGEGTIEGYGASYDLGKYGKVGFTSIDQKPSALVGLSNRTDLFQGFGDPSTPYFLTYEPLRTRPVVVKVQGVVQAEGVHYRFDETNPAVLYFLFFVPATSNVDITYTPKPTPSTDGIRKVQGFDYRLPFGKSGSLDYNQATGSVKNAAGSMGGTARGLNANYKLSGIDLRVSVKDIPNTFVGIQTRGFLRNERSTEFSAESNTGPILWGLSNSNSLVGNRKIATDGSFLFENARITRSRAFASHSPSPGSAWSLERTRNTSRTLTGETLLEGTALRGTFKRGRLNGGLGLEKTEGKSSLTAGGSDALSLDTASLSLGYDAGKAWALSARYGLSNVRTDEDSGRGTDMSFAANYQPSEKLRVELSHSRSDSGALAALNGFQGGFGYGYGGNGFSAGASPIGLLPTSGSNFRASQVGVTYQLSPRIHVGARANESLSSGSVSSNTENRSFAFDLDWALGGGLNTGLSLSQSSTKFLGGSAVSDATTMDWFLNGSPKGPWSYRLGATALMTSGASEFGQDSFGFDGSLSHRLDPRQRLSLSFRAGRTQGYLPQEDNFLGLFYEYQIINNLSLVSSYKWRRLVNLDSSLTGGYRSSGFDIELAFDFAP